MLVVNTICSKIKSTHSIPICILSSRYLPGLSGGNSYCGTRHPLEFVGIVILILLDYFAIIKPGKQNMIDWRYNNEATIRVSFMKVQFEQLELKCVRPIVIRSKVAESGDFRQPFFQPIDHQASKF